MTAHKPGDPTTLNRQGPDVGTSYRSAIFASTPQQLAKAKAWVAELQANKLLAGRKIVTEIVAPGPRFWPAEGYESFLAVRDQYTSQLVEPWVHGLTGAGGQDFRFGGAG